MFHFLQKKMLKKIHNKGTINVLQGGVSGVWSRTILLHFFFGPFPYTMTKMSNINIKKCQPPAGDMPDLIQTEHVPNRRLAHPKIKCSNKSNKIKTKKCQPPAEDRPDLIQTEHVPSRRLARPKRKCRRIFFVKNNSKKSLESCRP